MQKWLRPNLSFEAEAEQAPFHTASRVPGTYPTSSHYNPTPTRMAGYAVAKKL